jgi:regulatory protein
LNRPPAEKNAAADDFRQASAAALRLLVRREHSAQELRYKLIGRGYSTDLAEQVVAGLREEGALSDCRFAENYTLARFERGFGPVRIQAELRERGISSELAGGAVAVPAFDWALSAYRQRRKRFGDAAPKDFAERARQMRFLQQRGFDTEQIRYALANKG